ncbi:MAG: exodeoxyribonuclease VII large subunit [Lachnospiraceae bacterium]|nr:exodeoxyribonuclease VII large subunit [Lachnospiraceae bacterium]
MAKTIYRVSQVNAYIRNIFENDYALRQISVRGEVSNCKYNGSGHIYFTLKDETGALSCVMFAGKRARGLRFALADGQAVVVNGSVTVYERSGSYQLYASEIVLDGVGDLYQRFEETKRRLEEMGMFAAEYKKPIPRFVRTVGIVTASTGAAIQDIINISHRRNPYVQLILAPAIVQGDLAPASIVRGIRRLDEMGLDVIIVGRGGGSIEDLWAFNEEIVARAIFDANTPVISAVGHETDTTIADFVADLRAPTPSAAAELAVFDYMSFRQELDSLGLRLGRDMLARISSARNSLTAVKAMLERRSPGYRLQSRRSQLAMDADRISTLMHAALTGSRHALEMAAGRLSSLSPLDRIRGGYGFVSGDDGRPVKSVESVNAGDRLRIYVSDGSITARAESCEKEKITPDGRLK